MAVSGLKPASNSRTTFPHFGFHGADQQALGILGRNSVVMHRHIDDRNVDVGFGFFRNGDERKRAGDQQEQKRREDGA
jgi:hypothetical protein